MNEKNNETTNKRNKINVLPLVEFLTTDIEPVDLVNFLDQLEFEYVQLILQNLNTNIPLNAGEQVYFLHQLKEVIKRCSNTD